MQRLSDSWCKNGRFPIERYKAAAQLLEPVASVYAANRIIRHRWAADNRVLFIEIAEHGLRRTIAVDLATCQSTVFSAEIWYQESSTELISPDGTRALFTRGHNLWLRDRHGEQALTNDGEPLFAYGAMPEQSTRLFAMHRSTRLEPPLQCAWSPTGSHIIGHRLDERHVAAYPYLESVPLDGSFRPIVRSARMAMLGEPGPDVHPFLIAIDGGQVLRIRADEGWRLDALSPIWVRNGTRLFLLGERDDGREAGLFEVSLATGKARPVLVERGERPVFLNGYHYQAANVRVLREGESAIWFSERTGRGTLYHYDLADGICLGPIYEGPGVVLDLLAISESKGEVFATVGGSIAGDDPYRRDLFALPIDGGVPRRLTEPDHDHAIEGPLGRQWLSIAGVGEPQGPISPDCEVFIDRSSTLTSPTVATLRRVADGGVVVPLATTKMPPDLAWHPPVRFSVKAADGITDLWGTLWLPGDYDEAKRYPLIDALYGGPQITIAPRSFDDLLGQRGAPPGRASLAALGCFVMTVDARGTPGRDRAFREAGFGNFADLAVEDHAFVIEQLAARYPAIDTGRVGVIGHSFGGYVATRAMLRRPDLYAVGIASAAVHNWQGFRDAYRRYIGTPDYGGGNAAKPSPQSIPSTHAPLDNAALADRLVGRLLLAYGDMDENAMPASTLQFIQALTQAGKHYDLVYMPNGVHGFNTTPYFIQRCWDYFVEHLIGQKPPHDFRLDHAISATR